MIAKNTSAAEAFGSKLGSISNDGYPFASQRQDALKRVHRSQHISPMEADPEKVYVVRDSITVYDDNLTHGNYFCRGSLVKVTSLKDHDKANMVHVEVTGMTAYVSQNSSFGNTPAKMTLSDKRQFGLADASRFDLVELDIAIKALGV